MLETPTTADDHFPFFPSFFSFFFSPFSSFSFLSSASSFLAILGQAAKLIAPKIEKTFVEGFDFVIETLRATDNYMDIASDMEISKAVYFLKHKKPKEAKETLLAFEKKDQVPTLSLPCFLAPPPSFFLFFPPFFPPSIFLFFFCHPRRHTPRPLFPSSPRAHALSLFLSLARSLSRSLALPRAGAS